MEIKLIHYLDVIDPDTLVNVIDGTRTLDFGVHTIEELLEDNFFRSSVYRTATVAKVCAVQGDEPYICILVD